MCDYHIQLSLNIMMLLDLITINISGLTLFTNTSLTEIPKPYVFGTLKLARLFWHTLLILLTSLFTQKVYPQC